MRYTLDKSNVRNGLFNVLDNGQPTKAFAAEHIVFNDRCEVTGGEFRGGVFRGGVFRGGVFRGGEFHGGWFRGGVFRGGEFHGGEFHGGWFHGGEFHGGWFHGGWFHGGVFRGGVFRGGVFRGGEFRGGVFHGGVFHGGEFRGGVFRGGWLFLQIQGSRHFVNIPDGKTIAIGCQVHTPEFWVENFESIGIDHGYTPEQIIEYKRYIDLAAEVIRAAS